MNGIDVEELATRIAELETRKLAHAAEAQKRGDWIRIIFGSILACALVITATLMDIGGYRENQKTLNSLVHQHIDEYTPRKAEKIQALETDTKVNEQRITAMEKRLDGIDRKLDDILALQKKSR